MKRLIKDAPPSGLFSYRTEYGAKIQLHEIYNQLIGKEYEIAISSDRPGFISPVCNDEMYDEYIDCADIQDISPRDNYGCTIWEKDAFEKYIQHISFCGSFLIWFSSKHERVSDYAFDRKAWSQALFGYDGYLFIEIYSKYELKNIGSELTSIEYPGSIVAPGGLIIKT